MFFEVISPGPDDRNKERVFLLDKLVGLHHQLNTPIIRNLLRRAQIIHHVNNGVLLEVENARVSSLTPSWTPLNHLDVQRGC